MSLRVLFVESSVGGVGGSLHSLWTLVSHLDQQEIQAEILVFQEKPFWDRFRERGIPVHVWGNAGCYRAGKTAPEDVGGEISQPTEGSRQAAVALTVPGSAARLSQPAWWRALSGLWRLIREDLPLAWRLTRLVRSRRISILHANDRLGSNRFVTLAGWLSGCPVVQHERLVGPYGWTDVWLSGWLSETLCVSRQVAEAIRGMGHRGRSIRVVPNGVELPPERGQTRVAGRPRVGIVGRLVAWKGQDLFLEAMGRLAGHDTQPLFLIIGAAPPGNEGYAARLEDMARQPPLEGRVEFSGHVDDPLAAIASLSVLVVASRTPEPFGRTVVEAMGQGIPVVVPAAGGPAEVVDHGETGLHYPPGDAISLAQAVERLLDDPALARTMSERGRQVVSEQYRPEDQARTVSGIYHHLIPGEA